MSESPETVVRRLVRSIRVAVENTPWHAIGPALDLEPRPIEADNEETTVALEPFRTQLFYRDLLELARAVQKREDSLSERFDTLRAVLATSCSEIQKIGERLAEVDRCADGELRALFHRLLDSPACIVTGADPINDPGGTSEESEAVYELIPADPPEALLATIVEAAEDAGETSKEAETDPPPILSEAASVAYEILLEQPKHRGMTGPELLAQMDERGCPTDQSTLTSRIIPELKPYGVENVPRKGYRIPPSQRPS